jgi:LIM domain kinase 1
LKGENLLCTANGRLKITDFGFARIAARNEDESKRLTFCGTDSYMSPEILIGDEFDLPTDIFSFGIILCEIAARRLADDHHFKRAAPTFGIDPEEAQRLASPGCPPAFLALAIECCNTNPAARPTTRVILDRLRGIEAEVLMRPSEDNLHLGSVKFMTGGLKRPNAPRIPSFGMGIGKDIGANQKAADNNNSSEEGEESTSSDDELAEAIKNLPSIRLNSDWSDSAAATSSWYPSVFPICS